MGGTVELTLRKSLVVDCPVEAAFQVLADGMGTWWPVSTHSVGEELAERAVMECREGGRVFERMTDGSEVDWGRILIWEPPRRVAFSWHPGRQIDTAQEVEVRFEPEGGAWRVTLEQRGWDRLGDGAREEPEDYERGWEPVLSMYARRILAIE